MGEARCVYRVFGGGNLRERHNRNTNREWEDNIKANLQEVGNGGMGLIELAQDRDRWPALVNAVMNL
jgi:hypothetical protein